MSSKPTQLNFGRDINGYNAYSPQFPNDIFNGQLSAGVEDTFTIPSNLPMGCTHWIVIFGIESGSNIFVAKNATAIVATGAAASASSVLNPTQMSFDSGDVIHLITSDTTAKWSASIYATVV